MKGPVVRFSASGRSLDTIGGSFNLQTCISTSRWSGLSRTQITRSVYLAKRIHSHSSVRSIPWQRRIITVPKNRRQTKESNLQAHKHGQPIRSAGSTLHLGFSTLYSAEHSFTNRLQKRFTFATGRRGIVSHKKEIEVYMQNESHCEPLRAFRIPLVFCIPLVFHFRIPLGGLPFCLRYDQFPFKF